MIPQFLRRDRYLLAAILFLVGILLTASSIRGVFIIDEDNYLVSALSVRQGSSVVENTRGLSPSRELDWFDPDEQARPILSTPVFSAVPSLYAFFAQPFLLFGWQGLILLNVISLLGVVWVAFEVTRMMGTRTATPWIAAALVLLGGYNIEYAQGVWPHMLSAFLCIASFRLALRPLLDDSPGFALASGLMIGIAAGVREQDIIVGAGLAFCILVWSRRRIRAFAAFSLGIGAVILVLSILNFERLGQFYPIPKAVTFVNQLSGKSHPSLFEPLQALWARIVDYSSFGPIRDPLRAALYGRDPGSNAVLLNGIVKKAWLQSSPWLVLSLLAIAVGIKHRAPNNSRPTQFRWLAALILPMLIVIALPGFSRTDGLCFNQRYFLDIFPFAAIACALLLDEIGLNTQSIIAGFFFGLISVTLTLNVSVPLKYLLQLYFPLAIAFALLLAWLIRSRLRSTIVLSALLGISVGYSFFIHLETDLVGSRTRRHINEARLNDLESAVPGRSALFVYWGNKDAAGPLQIDKDVVIVDAWADGGTDAPLLAGELLKAKRRVFVFTKDFPDSILQHLHEAGSTRTASESSTHLVEILPREPRDH